MNLKRIRDLREDSDFTQQQIADLLGIKRRTYAAYETGDNAISIDLIIELAKIYDVNLYYILGLTNERTPF